MHHYKKYREFGGMRYRLHGHYSTKKEAEDVAAMKHRNGELARVVEHKHGYCVYVHGKE